MGRKSDDSAELRMHDLASDAVTLEGDSDRIDDKTAFLDSRQPELMDRVVNIVQKTTTIIRRHAWRLKFYATKQITVLLLAVIISCWMTFLALQHPSSPLTRIIAKAPSGLNHAYLEANYVKPKGLKVVGVIFYGRPETVDILDCYLKRNLVSRGGWLDEVIFYQNTESKKDVAWLNNKIKNEPLYRKVNPDGGSGFDKAYRLFHEEETIYVKMDDDLLYMHDDAIPALVTTLVENPDAYIVLGNLVNSPLCHYFHYHTGAIYPYMEETIAPPPRNTSTWRASELPHYNGPLEYEWKGERPNEKDTKAGSPNAPRFNHGRFLPVMPSNVRSLLGTPISQAKLDPFGPGLKHWAIIAQQQYSLFQNLENNTMWRYHFGDENGIWRSRLQHRANLNFAAIYGKTIQLRLPGRDDENDLTIKYPKEARRDVLFQTRAVAAHYSFGGGLKWISLLDLIDRYRAYANEFVCEADNQKTPLPDFDHFYDLSTDETIMDPNGDGVIEGDHQI